jgi:hypothetical protein
MTDKNRHICRLKTSKLQSVKKGKPPAAFLTAYPDAEFSVVTKDNFDEFLLK